LSSSRRARRPRRFDARHSPRPPLTAENFDFVTTDRSDDGSPANDLGRLRAGRPPSRLSTRPPRASTTAATSRAPAAASYIKGVDATAISLTPSFKIEAVRLQDGPSAAGYHAYG
jgi:hypothetical protein